MGDSRLLLPAHNTYLMIWSELGIVGVGLWLAGLLTIIVQLRPNQQPLLTIWAGCILALSVIMITDFYFWGDVRSRTMLFWAIGLGWGIRYILQKADDKTEVLDPTQE